MVESIDCYYGVLCVEFQQGFNMTKCGTSVALRILSVYSTAPDEIVFLGVPYAK